jgi:tetratricopeptide (TPR) repeat protein
MAACLALATGAVAGASAAGGRADPFQRTWCELRTADYRLVTDRPRDEARALASRLNAFRPLAEHYLPGARNALDPELQILLFQNARDFRRAVGNLGGVVGFMQPSLAGNLLVVGPDPAAGNEHETLLHEYTHYLLRTRTGLHLPAWFDEGLASFLASAEFGDGDAFIGALPIRRLEAAMHGSRLTLAQALEAEDLWRWRGDRRRAFYAWSWLLVHRLLLGHEAGLADGREALHHALSVEGAALPDALGVTRVGLQRELERYAQRPAPRARHSIAEVSGTVAGYRCLDDRELTLTLSMAMMPGNAPDAVRRLDGLSARLPDDAAVWVHLSLASEYAGDSDRALAAARRAHELDDGVDGAIRVAGALSIGCILTTSEACRERWREAVPLLRGALADDPHRHDAAFLLGLAYLYSGRPGEALNYLRIAHRRQPWATHINYYLGESYRLIGDTRAREHLQRARSWSNSQLWRILADASLDLLEDRAGVLATPAQ